MLSEWPILEFERTLLGLENDFFRGGKFNKLMVKLREKDLAGDDAHKTTSSTRVTVERLARMTSLRSGSSREQRRGRECQRCLTTARTP